MQVVINMPEDVYNYIKANGARIPYYKLTDAIKNGTPLPKGHGRLGDLDALRKEVSSWGMNDYEPSDFIDEIDRADTIIESDFHCGFEESGGHAYNCNDCPNKCEEYYQWDKEMRK